MFAIVRGIRKSRNDGTGANTALRLLAVLALVAALALVGSAVAEYRVLHAVTRLPEMGYEGVLSLECPDFLGRGRERRRYVNVGGKCREPRQTEAGRILVRNSPHSGLGDWQATQRRLPSQTNPPNGNVTPPHGIRGGPEIGWTPLLASGYCFPSQPRADPAKS